jgi:hypothetical protein
MIVVLPDPARDEGYFSWVLYDPRSKLLSTRDWWGKLFDKFQFLRPWEDQIDSARLFIYTYCFPYLQFLQSQQAYIEKSLDIMRQSDLGILPTIIPELDRIFVQQSAIASYLYFVNKRLGGGALYEPELRGIRTSDEFQARVARKYIVNEAANERNAALGAFPVPLSHVQDIIRATDKPFPRPPCRFVRHPDQEIKVPPVADRETKLLEYNFFPANAPTCAELRIKSAAELLYAYVGDSQMVLVTKGVGFKVYVLGKSSCNLDDTAPFCERDEQFHFAIFNIAHSTLIVCVAETDVGSPRHLLSIPVMGNTKVSRTSVEWAMHRLVGISANYFAIGYVCEKPRAAVMCIEKDNSVRLDDSMNWQLTRLPNVQRLLEDKNLFICRGRVSRLEKAGDDVVVSGERANTTRIIPSVTSRGSRQTLGSLVRDEEMSGNVELALVQYFPVLVVYEDYVVRYGKKFSLCRPPTTEREVESLVVNHIGRYMRKISLFSIEKAIGRCAEVKLTSVVAATPNAASVVDFVFGTTFGRVDLPGIWVGLGMFGGVGHLIVYFSESQQWGLKAAVEWEAGQVWVVCENIEGIEQTINEARIGSRFRQQVDEVRKMGFTEIESKMLKRSGRSMQLLSNQANWEVLLGSLDGENQAIPTGQAVGRAKMAIAYAVTLKRLSGLPEPVVEKFCRAAMSHTA